MTDKKSPVEGPDPEQRQAPLIHEGASADAKYDTNERADDAATIVEPDGAPSPRAE
jgi:hypothetical protein